MPALLTPPRSAHAAPEAGARVDALLAQLARPAPSRLDFVEIRASALLDTPVRATGTLEHPDADTLVRAVRTPSPERTTIRGERVEIEREGRGTRRFALDRAPQLAGLLASFRAIVGGDGSLLERYYDARVDGRLEGRWLLTLTPREPALAEHVAWVALHGEGDAPLCLELEQRGEGGSMMLLGAAAAAAAGVDDGEALTRLCRGAP